MNPPPPPPMWKIKPTPVGLRGHVQTILTSLCLRGGTNYYSKILLQLCLAELTLYQMLESGKNTSLHQTDDCDNVS